MGKYAFGDVEALLNLVDELLRLGEFAAIDFDTRTRSRQVVVQMMGKKKAD